MTYYNYIFLYSFLIFILCLFLKIESFTPTGRYGHSSVLAGNRLYFFGGNKNYFNCSNEVLYLDVSQNFDIVSSPWVNLTTNEGMLVNSCWGAASLSITNNDQNIYLFGGMTRDIVTNSNVTSFIYKYNLNSGKWDIPKIKEKVPESRVEIKAVSDNSGKIYIFGGQNITNVFNDMVIFNAFELSWSISYLSNALAGYSATMLSNGVIVYIGGFSSINVIQYVDISQINLYDTNSLTWSTKKANVILGQIDGRDSHTAVLAPDGKIIICGGAKGVMGMDVIINIQVTPNIAILNTNTEPFEWNIPLVSSNINSVIPSLMGHTANIVGHYMIVAFGNITQPNTLPTSTNPNIYILDTKNYTWINTFELPTPTFTPISTPSVTNIQSVITGVVSGFVVVVALMTIGFFGYKWHKKHQREKQSGIMRLHGSNTP